MRGRATSLDEARAIVRRHRRRVGRRRPGELEVRVVEQPLGASARSALDEEQVDAFVAGAAGATRAMGQRLGVLRQIGVHDEADVGQIEPARRDVGGDEHAHVAVAQRLERARALFLRAIARDRGGEKAARR